MGISCVTSVVSSPAGSGIYCGTVCRVDYPSATSVTLTATAVTGSTFAGWSGDCTGTATTCTVSMDQVRNVAATFKAGSGGPNTISVYKAGTGFGVVSSPAGSGLYCGNVCRVDYPSSTSVTLTATAVTGSIFAGWSGDCSGMATTCTVSMSQARNVAATFSAATILSQTNSVRAAFALPPVGLYDGLYQWDAGQYLSVHQKGDGSLIGSIYGVYTANTEQVGARTISEVDTFDLLHGQLVGSSATMSGTRFYRACMLVYDFTFNSDSSLTVHLNSAGNSAGVSTAEVDCAARFQAAGSVWIIPRIY